MAMKPELKALWRAILDAPVGDPGGLHWSGDELWCAGLQVGRVHHANDDGEDYFFGYVGTKYADGLTKAEACAALEAAARQQIEAWLEVQKG